MVTTLCERLGWDHLARLLRGFAERIAFGVRRELTELVRIQGSAQQQSATYAGMVTTLCERLGWDHLARLLRGFAERIAFGVRRELTELVRIQGSAQQQSATYAGMVTTLCERLGWDHLARLLRGFAERIAFGVRRELTELVRIQGSAQQQSATYAGMVTTLCERLGWDHLARLLRGFAERIAFGVRRELTELVRIQGSAQQQSATYAGMVTTLCERLGWDHLARLLRGFAERIAFGVRRELTELVRIQGSAQQQSATYAGMVTTLCERLGWDHLARLLRGFAERIAFGVRRELTELVRIQGSAQQQSATYAGMVTTLCERLGWDHLARLLRGFAERIAFGVRRELTELVRIQGSAQQQSATYAGMVTTLCERLGWDHLARLLRGFAERIAFGVRRELTELVRIQGSAQQQSATYAGMVTTLCERLGWDHLARLLRGFAERIAFGVRRELTELVRIQGSAQQQSATYAGMVTTLCERLGWDHLARLLRGFAERIAFGVRRELTELVRIQGSAQQQSATYAGMVTTLCERLGWDHLARLLRGFAERIAFGVRRELTELVRIQGSAQQQSATYAGMVTTLCERLGWDHLARLLRGFAERIAFGVRRELTELVRIQGSAQQQSATYAGMVTTLCERLGWDHLARLLRGFAERIAFGVRRELTELVRIQGSAQQQSATYAGMVTTLCERLGWDHLARLLRGFAERIAFGVRRELTELVRIQGSAQQQSATYAGMVTTLCERLGWDHLARLLRGFAERIAFGVRRELTELVRIQGSAQQQSATYAGMVTTLCERLGWDHLARLLRGFAERIAFGVRRELTELVRIQGSAQQQSATYAGMVTTLCERLGWDHLARLLRGFAERIAFGVRRELTELVRIQGSAQQQSATYAGMVTTLCERLGWDHLARLLRGFAERIAFGVRRELTELVRIQGSAQQQSATYAGMVTTLCERLGWDHLARLLRGFAERIAFGVRRELTELVRIQGSAQQQSATYAGMVTTLCERLGWDHLARLLRGFAERIALGVRRELTELVRIQGSAQQQSATYAGMVTTLCERLGWDHLARLLRGFAERIAFGVRRELTELVRIQGSAQQQSATYAGMVTTLCERLGWDHLARLLRGFAERIAFGVRRELTELVRIQGVDGGRARALHEAGLTSLSLVALAEAPKVAGALRRAVAFRTEEAKTSQAKTEEPKEAAGTGKAAWLAGEPELEEAEAVELLRRRASALVRESLAELGFAQAPDLKAIAGGKRPSPLSRRRAAEERRRSSLGSVSSPTASLSTPSARLPKRRSPLSQLNGFVDSSTPLSAGHRLRPLDEVRSDVEDDDSLVSLDLDEGAQDTPSSITELRDSPKEPAIPDHKVSAKALLSRNLARRSQGLAKDEVERLSDSVTNVSLDDDVLPGSPKEDLTPSKVQLSDSSIERILQVSFGPGTTLAKPSSQPAKPPRISLTPSEAEAVADLSVDWEPRASPLTAVEQAGEEAKEEPNETNASEEDLFGEDSPGPSSRAPKRAHLPSTSVQDSPSTRSPALRKRKSDDGSLRIVPVCETIASFEAFAKLVAKKKGCPAAVSLLCVSEARKPRRPPIGGRFASNAEPAEESRGVELSGGKRLLGVSFSFAAPEVHHLSLEVGGGEHDISFTPEGGTPSLKSRLGLLADALHSLPLVAHSAQELLRLVWRLPACQRHLRKASPPPAFDARTAAWVLSQREDAPEPALHSLFALHLPHSSLKAQLQSLDPVERSAATCLLLHQLRVAMEEKLSSELRAALPQELAVLPLLARMEVVGMGLDEEEAKALETKLLARMRQLEREAGRMLGKPISLTSPSEVSRALFTTLKLPHPGKPRGSGARRQLSTSKEVLEQLRDAHPLASLVLEHRQLAHSHSTGLLPLLRHSLASPAFLEDAGRRVRGLFDTWTATGRIVMSTPNLQNLAKETILAGEELSLRSLCAARDGCLLLAADFSQLELRVLAALSGDEGLSAVLSRESGDVFRVLAAQWGRKDEDDVSPKERQHTKQLCYGLIYGMGAGTMAAGLGISETEARDLMRRFRQTFPQLSEWCEGTIGACGERGFVSTLAGRRRYIGRLGKEAQMERQAVNSAVQGSAADIFKAALLATERVLAGTEATLVMQLHDEVILEVPRHSLRPTALKLKAGLERCWSLSGVPLRVKLQKGPTWGALTELRL